MIYHVLPGDAVAGVFKEAKIGGELIVCREVFVTGPIDAENIDEFWDERAKFILADYGEDEILYHETVADQLAKLGDLTADNEVYLWFEYELFCSVNMWFCLWMLSQTGATIYRVEPIGLEIDNRWDGFGKFESDDLKACFEMRTKLSDADIALGSALWQAYRRKDFVQLKELAKSATDAFPYLGEVVAAAINQDVEPLKVVRAITSGGETDFGKIFAEFKKRAGVYGYGDLQVQRIIDALA
ncbi:MAG: DUF1835 domain-containing protein [Chloracidobacterium sp.]|nr:DUF1835 domain-containing protein [Chloracidobacterium sp.]